jgi:hypothetical protein
MPMIAEHEVQTTESWGPDALEDAREAGRKQQDSIARERDQWIRSNRYFYDRIRKALQFIIEPNKRVLELRCETGHMPAWVWKLATKWWRARAKRIPNCIL